MKESKIRWTVPTWTLVGIGLLLNIISAMMTNFYIDELTRQANSLIQRQQANEKLISLTWQQVETIERKREHILVLLATSEAANTTLPEVIELQLQQDVNNWLHQNLTSIRLDNLPNVMINIDTAQMALRDKINQLYLDNLDLVTDYGAKMKSISRLRNLALFLQIIGLALVLARDLNWRDYAK
ncbi:hypothetical protein [Photobacterium nomapromontoriensis]|uniref:hypothetical protein n=1 Tax=Photobacterium nomapromontoriensis TaxID=2910237 RepID=UPI003D0DCD98